MGQGFPSQRLGVNISAAGTGTASGLAQTGTVVFSNSNGFTFGMFSTQSSYVITLNGGTPSPAAISAGTTLASTGTIVFSNSNSITFGLSGNTITASFSQSVQPGPGGIAAGTQTATNGTVVFANSNGISFGMSGSSQITAQMPTARFFAPRHDLDGVNSMVPSSGSINLSLQRISIPFNFSATEADVLAALTVAGSTAGSFTLSIAAYTFAGSTASSASSTSIAYTFNSGTNSTAASIYGGNSGTRWRSIPLATWNLTPGGDYLLAFMGSIAGVAGTTGSMTLYGRSGQSIVAAVGGGNFSGCFFDGIFSVGTGAFPSSIHLSAINQTGQSVLAQPYFRLIGTGP
jgi:hypothetical protein